VSLCFHFKTFANILFKYDIIFTFYGKITRKLSRRFSCDMFAR